MNDRIDFEKFDVLKAIDYSFYLDIRNTLQPNQDSQIHLISKGFIRACFDKGHLPVHDVPLIKLFAQSNRLIKIISYVDETEPREEKRKKFKYDFSNEGRLFILNLLVDGVIEFTD